MPLSSKVFRTDARFDITLYHPVKCCSFWLPSCIRSSPPWNRRAGPRISVWTGCICRWGGRVGRELLPMVRPW